jgi:cell division protease FtsH
MSDKKRKLVAYHEAGHAIVGALMPEYDPVTKISIVPRGAAGERWACTCSALVS